MSDEQHALPAADLAAGADDSGGGMRRHGVLDQRDAAALFMDSLCHTHTHTLRYISGKSSHSRTVIILWDLFHQQAMCCVQVGDAVHGGLYGGIDS